MTGRVEIALEIVDRMLDAPCLWCGYNGKGYWQSGTHDEHCPWLHLASEDERLGQLLRIIEKLARRNAQV